jgi:hypothetical protein
MIDKIKEYIGEAQQFSTQDVAELEAFRIKFLGSKGLLKDFLPSSGMFLPSRKRSLDKSSTYSKRPPKTR